MTLHGRAVLCCVCRFAESFRSLHSKKLQAAEDKSVAMFVSGDMPAARGKKKLKPMTEVGGAVVSTSFLSKQTVYAKCCGAAFSKGGKERPTSCHFSKNLMHPSFHASTNLVGSMQSLGAMACGLVLTRP